MNSPLHKIKRTWISYSRLFFVWRIALYYLCRMVSVLYSMYGVVTAAAQRLLAVECGTEWICKRVL